MNSFIHVAVAVIRNQQGQVLVTQRPEHVHQGGLWEFPGGKVEPSESVQEALRREIYEELDISIQNARPLIKIPFSYPDKQVLLDVWEVLQFSGVPYGKEGQPWNWTDTKELYRLSFPAANRPVISALQLPPQLLVTPDPGTDKDRFLQNLRHSIGKDVRMLLLRAKSLSPAEYNALAREVCDVCGVYDTTVMLNTDVSNVLALGAGGLHVTAEQLLAYHERPLSQDYWFSASCHNEKEIEHAGSIGVDFIFVGSVRTTSSHPESKPLGWQEFSRLTELAQIPVFAIGGMTADDLNQVRNAGGQGIAAISALWGKND